MKLLSGHIKQILATLILCVTAGLFIYFFASHPEYVTRVKQTSPLVIASVLAINFLGVFILAAINQITVRLAGKRIDGRENFLLTIYSSIANFFGPLQSGPGVRAAYLKTKHGIKLRSYTAATLLYFAIFAVISAVFLLVGTCPWWQTLLGAISCGGLSFAVIRWYAKKNTHDTLVSLQTPRLIGLLAILTLAQLLCIAVRYYIELRSINASISVGQALSYAGAANFSLFVSITPDGVGIREAFLLASQQIHGINPSEIVAANLIDRATYVLYLGLLFILALSLHAKQKLKIK